MMKPKAQNPNETGLLEYLEDIIGTDKYVEPIEQHYKQLEEVSETRQGMVARVKLVERERDGLEDDKLLAESYLTKQRDMHVHKAKVAQLYIHAGQVCGCGWGCFVEKGGGCNMVVLHEYLDEHVVQYIRERCVFCCHATCNELCINAACVGLPIFIYMSMYTPLLCHALSPTHTHTHAHIHTHALTPQTPQENITTIDTSITKLNEKLQYEKDKAKEANGALEQAEQAYVGVGGGM